MAKFDDSSEIAPIDFQNMGSVSPLVLGVSAVPGMADLIRLKWGTCGGFGSFSLGWLSGGFQGLPGIFNEVADIFGNGNPGIYTRISEGPSQASLKHSHGLDVWGLVWVRQGIMTPRIWDGISVVAHDRPNSL